jgi:hypothetical protein
MVDEPNILHGQVQDLQLALRTVQRLGRNPASAELRMPVFSALSNIAQ